MKTISILGSTGSIGTQALSIIRDYPEIRVAGISCDKNIALLEEQIREFKPKFACVMDEELSKELAIKVADTDTKVLAGMEGLITISTLSECQMVLTAVVGMIGIRPTYEAIMAGKDIALANKETLVCAGKIIMEAAEEKNVAILPVDSEHSAIFQSLKGHPNKIKKIVLTASGGPFFGKTAKELKNVSLKEALNHPNWSMGKKITVDSATLMNKGLEVIEACHLFKVTSKDIDVVVHRESILHSAVEYEDGAIIGQLGLPDMRVPIAYALFYPNRRPLKDNHLSLTEIGKMTFYEPDMDTFFGLKMCIDAINKGGNTPSVLNAANEIAVERFIAGKIGFLQMQEVLENALSKIPFVKSPDLEEILGIYDLVLSISG